MELNEDTNIDTMTEKTIVDEPQEEEQEEQEEENYTGAQLDDSATAVKLNLLLGDVIKIMDPENEELNTNTFLIDYIDNSKIKLINTSTLDQTILQINEGVLGAGTINGIEILHRSEFPGYARQNDLLPGKWINIFFGGETPVIITGEITNLEEDMIELRTYPEGDTIYINFGFKGIPEDIPIEGIEIREKPSIITPENAEESLEEQGERTVTDGEKVLSADEEPTLIEELEPDTDSGLEDTDNLVLNVPRKEIRNQIREFILRGDQVIFGDEDFGSIVQTVDISEEKQRYSIETQANDLLDQLLSNVPNSERTSRVLNSIHTQIERFKQLRTAFSTFDENGNIVGFIKKSADWKPLAKELCEFKNTLLWLVPVVKNIKKIYYDEKETGGNMDDTEVSDVAMISLNDDLDSMNNKFALYKSNANPDEQNKYVSLYADLNAELTPFESVNPERISDIIYEHGVATDLNVIIDNLGDFYSSVSQRENTVSRRFVITKYNLGLKRLAATQITGSRMVATRVPITPPDEVSIRSLLTLPEPMVKFSHITLPNTNILDKANLNSIFLNYWQLLKRNTKVEDVLINDFDEPEDYDEKGFLNNIKNYVLSLSEEEIVELTGRTFSKVDIYKAFLEKVVPKTRVLFNMVKKYIKGKLSIVDVVSYLEPFLIYCDDLTYFQYKEITDFLYKQISEYNSNFAKKGNAFGILKAMRERDDYNPSVTAIYNIFKANRGTQEMVFENYDYNPSSLKLTNSELLRKIILKDSGNLYNSAATLENIKYMFSDKLSGIIENDKLGLNEKKTADETDNSCKKYVIAKQYRSQEQLEADNDTDIFYDKDYDKTNYSMLDEFYKEIAAMTTQEFSEFLIGKLKTKYKLADLDAEILSETLIGGFKPVSSGDYAILFDLTDDKMHYYRRDKKKWVLDEEVDGSIFVDDSNLFCNIQESCVDVQKVSDSYSDSNCVSLDLNKDTLMEQNLKKIMDEFDKSYEVSKEELLAKITGNVEYYASIFDKLNTISLAKFFKYNNQQFELGMKTDDIKDIVVSPYLPLLNIILGQTDFIKKQNDIIRFRMMYTRDAIADTDGRVEMEHWLYCKDTGAQLLPTFLYSLANAFVNSYENYHSVMDSIIAKCGQLSDEGDAWIDKYTGRVIRMIDFDVDEGYEGGFRVSTREIMEQDAGDAITSAAALKPVTPETRIISNIINTLASSMGINIESQAEFICSGVTDALKDFLPTEAIYKKHMQDMAKKGKNIPIFKDLSNTTILYFTLAYFLIGLQTMIPSVKTRRTFPGCNQSFKGYPIEGAGDDSAVQYLACVAYAIRSATPPWYTLQKKKIEYIITKIKEAVEKVWTMPAIMKKVDEKAEYLLLNKDDDLPDEYALAKWRQFLPPLVNIKIRNLVNISTEFKSSLVSSLKSGSTQQREKLLIVESKIIQFSLAIQEKIQQIIAKKSALLQNASGIAFIENACCSETTQKSTIHYFEKESPDITSYNDIVKSLSNILLDIHNVTKSPYLFCREDSKMKYPSVGIEFAEETIYRAFISFCRFNSIIPISDDLIALCSNKPDFITPGSNPLSNDNIGEVISRMKSDGINYTNESFLRLLQIVNRSNIVSVDLNRPVFSAIQRIRNVLENIAAKDESVSGVVNPALQSRLNDILDTYDIGISEDTPEMRALKNHLAKTNAEMKAELFEFVNKNNTILGKRKGNIKALLDNVLLWKVSQREKMNVTDSTTTNSLNFIKNYIFTFLKTFPSIILNSVDYDETRIPKHWKLSNMHGLNIKKMIADYYKKLKGFYKEKPLTVVLSIVQERCSGLLELINETPYFSSIKYKDQETVSVFDKRTSDLLMEQYLLLVLTEYMHICDNEDALFEYQEKQNITFEEIFTVEDTEERNIRTDLIDTEVTENYSLEGTKKNLRVLTSNLLLVYLTIMNDHKDAIDITYENIMDRVFKLQEKEKDDIRDRLEGLSQEERNVDNIMKSTKQGLWNKGLQKGLTAYSAEDWDDDRDFVEKLKTVERRVRTNLDVNDDNVELYMDDYLEQEAVADAIELDEYNMGDMTEDYMDGTYAPNTMGNGDDIDFDEYL